MPKLTESYVHLGRPKDGRGPTCEVQPPFTGMEWYAAYTTRTDVDGDEGRLVSLYTFTESWTSWEMHPVGEELVICTAGEVTLVQEVDDPDGQGKQERRITLGAGDYAVNDAGVWHTADIPPGGSCTCVFITAGRGTEPRAR